MIDLENKTIILLGAVYEITAFEVWWMSPFGISQDLEEALERIKVADLTFLSLRPVPVARSNNPTIYEIVPSM